MTRTSLDTHNCSLARTVDIIGDKWTLVILRDCFYGVRKFADFQDRLGVAKTVLSARLKKLTSAGILDRVQPDPNIQRHEYRLTAKGRDLFPLIVSLTQWGDQWIHGEGEEPIRLERNSNGIGVARIKVKDTEGTEIELGDIGYRAGPGATAITKSLILAANTRYTRENV